MSAQWPFWRDKKHPGTDGARGRLDHRLAHGNPPARSVQHADPGPYPAARGFRRRRIRRRLRPNRRGHVGARHRRRPDPRARTDPGALRHRIHIQRHAWCADRHGGGTRRLTHRRLLWRTAAHVAVAGLGGARGRRRLDERWRRGLAWTGSSEPFSSSVFRLFASAALGVVAYATALGALWAVQGRPDGAEADVLGAIYRLSRRIRRKPAFS